MSYQDFGESVQKPFRVLGAFRGGPAAFANARWSSLMDEVIGWHWRGRINA
jgi:hypothetical protein